MQTGPRGVVLALILAALLALDREFLLAQPRPEGTNADEDPATHLAFLAREELKGRVCGSRGFAKAADYVWRFVRNYDFEGANPGGATPYLQPFRVSAYDPDCMRDDVLRAVGPPDSDPGLFERGYYEGAGRESLEIIRGHLKNPGQGLTTADLRRCGKRRRAATNIVARCRGSSQPGEYVLLMAHLDGCDKKGCGFSAADDNATGSATLLASVPALSRLCKSGSVKKSILLAWTDAEELGLLGADYLRNNGLPGIPRHSIKAVINLDTVGRGPANSLSMIDSDRHGQANYLGAMALSAAAEAPAPFDHLGHGIDNLRPYQDGAVFSYNYSLAEDIPTLFLFEGLDATGDYYPPGIHNQGDDATSVAGPETAEKLRRISLLLVRMVREAANRP